MAKIHVTSFVPNGHQYLESYSSLYLDSYSKKQAMVKEEDGSDYIVLHGKNLEFKKGFLVGGTITDIEYKNGLTNDYATFEDVGYEVTKKMDFAGGLYAASLSGNDKITGSDDTDILHGLKGSDKLFGLGGDDTLISSPGKTTMIGGTGSDHFHFFSENKIGIVKDFDAVGGGDQQDYFSFDGGYDEMKNIYGDHGDTILDFGHGKKIILEGVDRGDVSEADFQFPPILSPD